MEHLNRLYIDNSQKIDELLGEDYTKKSAYDSLKTTDVLEANEALADHLYGTEVSSLVRSNNTQALDQLALTVLESVSASQATTNGLDTTRISLIVVRPEAMDFEHATEQFLINNGLAILLNKVARIGFPQYWSLYNPGLRDPDAQYDFPTRTLNYINKDIRVLIVKAAEGLGATSISSYITDNLKGRQGSFTSNTLRGDIAHTALSRLVAEDGQSFVHPRANIALDPIGAYRKLVRGDIASDRAHASAQIPLLFYAGQSMHVPNDLEIDRDVRILLTEDEIINITMRLDQ